MTNPQINVSLVEQLPALVPDRLEEAREHFYDDFVWHYINPELPQIQGDYDGLDGLKTFFMKLGELTHNTFKVRIKQAHAVGHEFVMVHACPSMTIDDYAFETDAVVVWRIVDQRFKEAWDIPGLHSLRPQST
ncbi:MAG: nuclear transport factor 2 family protein [Leptolyngbya sp. SIO1E4]|nr:nuclear transport factor 2 family protein [Leptolyngbya sp. SIO1E4]